MPNYFYFDQTNQKHGPIDDQQLRELAVAGIIKPNTPLETVEGHKGIAKQIPGLSFTVAATPSSVVPEWYAMAAMICGIACIVLTLFVLSGELYQRYLIEQEKYELIDGLQHWSFCGNMLRDIVFVVGMFFGCRGMSVNKALIAKIGLILCIVAFVIPRLYWISQYWR